LTGISLKKYVEGFGLKYFILKNEDKPEIEEQTMFCVIDSLCASVTLWQSAMLSSYI